MNADRHEAVPTHGDGYQEVSLRAVELLAKAQRAADEAVAEAQSYARDLEESAREQYKQILQRAHAAAQGSGSTAPTPAADAGHAPAGAAPGSLDAEQLRYVRTYARVAHAQLKAVLSALNDELDQLAVLAEGASVRPTTQAAVAEPAQRPRQVDKWDRGVTSAADPGRPGESSWPPIFAATNAISYVFRGSTSGSRES